MENSRRPRGRPPGPTQTVPLFLHQVRSRVKTRLVISTVTEHELRAYVPWAARHVMMAADEILVRVVDRALDEYFKRDKLWRKEREAVLSGAALSCCRNIRGDSTAAPEAEEAEARTVALASEPAPTPYALAASSDLTAVTAPASRSEGRSR